MTVKTDLINRYISDYITNQITDFEIDEELTIELKSIKILEDVQKILADENYNDFEAIEKIVKLFETNGIDTGFRHNF